MKKQRKFFVVVILILSLLIMHSGNHVVKATSFESAKDTISDSDLGITNVTHDFEFNLTNYATSSNILRITWPSGFSDISPSATCPNGGTASTTGRILDCTGVFLVSTSTITDLSATSTNPSTAGSYLINLELLDENYAQRESATVRVYILDDVDVTATVPATLTFSISGTTTGAVINGVATTGSSATTTLAFGTISDNNKKTLGQTLEVTTNASAGFSVTVEQSQNLQTAGSSDIDPLWGATSTTAYPTGLAWTAPSPDLNLERTWGHFGITGTDMGVTSELYRSLDSVSVNSAVESATVMSHNGPSDGLTEGIGRAHVAFSLQISDLQESGDYSTTMTYVCTPTY